MVIIDESSPSNNAISDALRNAGVNPASFQSPADALTHLELNALNLIIANVPLSEQHGLDIARIMQLPMHAATPIIFVSELLALDHTNGSLPTSAPLVNTNPLLLRELVMKTLNEMQSKDGPHDRRARAMPAPTPPVQQQVKPDKVVTPPPSAAPRSPARASTP